MALPLRTKIQGPVAVIGDVHGQIDKLSVVLEKLKTLPDYDLRWIIFIGDFVDRGDNPKQAIDLFIQLLKEHPRTTAIAGNHEFAMCAALGWLPTVEPSSAWAERWIKFYNSETTFTSYGAEVGNLDDLNSKVPQEHRELLSGLPWCVEHPQLLFVHAGLDPNAPFDMQLRILQQKDFSLNRPQWLCEKAFVDLDPPRDCPFVVVSGHVRVSEVIMRPKRILVDTTGGTEGNLSCVLLPERKIIASDRKPVPSLSPSPTATAKKPKSSWWKLWA